MEHAGGRFVVSDAPQRSRRQPSRNLPPALPAARPRASDLKGQQVDGKARGGDPDVRRCPGMHDVDLRFSPSRHRVSSAPLAASPRRPRRGLLDRRKGSACLAQRAASSSCGHSVPTRVRAMHVVTEQKDQSRICDLSSFLPATATSSGICRNLQTRVSDPNHCRFLKREKARPPERSGCWLRRRPLAPRG